MTAGITIQMDELTKADAAKMAPAFARYQIEISNLKLFAIWLKDGKPTRYDFDKIEDIIDVMIERDAKEAAERGESFEPNRADYAPESYELDFSFVGVSADRRAWAESVLGSFCRRNVWDWKSGVIHAAAFRQGWNSGKLPAATWQASRQASRIRMIGVPRSISRRLSRMFFA